MTSDELVDRLLKAYQSENVCNDVGTLVQPLIETLKDQHEVARLAAEISAEPFGWDLPREFGDFTLISLVGAGGMGEVFLGIHRKLGREQAVKLLPQHRLGQREVEERFHRESQIIAKLNHPSIVTVFDAGIVDGTPYLAMELVEGQSMAQIVEDAKRNNKEIDLATACSWIVQAAEGIQHAHECGILHRDIKPGNLMVTTDSKVKVLDLGLAKMTDSRQSPVSEALPNLTQAGQILGTPSYMAPEQVTHETLLTPATDVYALAATLFKLLALRTIYKFEGSGLVNQAIAIVQQTPDRLDSCRSDIPPELADVVVKALSKSPKDRQQSMREFAQQISPFVTQNESKLSIAAKPTSIRKRFANLRVIVVAMISAGLLALAFGIVLVLSLGADGKLVIRCEDESVKIKVNRLDRTQETLLIESANKGNINLAVGDYAIELIGVPDGEYQISSDRFTIVANGEVVVDIEKKQPSETTRGSDPELISSPGVRSTELALPLAKNSTAKLINIKGDFDIPKSKYRGLIPRPQSIPGVPPWQLQTLLLGDFNNIRDNYACVDINSNGEQAAFCSSGKGFVRNLDTGQYESVLIAPNPGEEFSSVLWRIAVNDDGATGSQRLVWIPPNADKGDIVVSDIDGNIHRRIKLHNAPEKHKGTLQIAPVGNSNQFLIFSRSFAAICDTEGRVHSYTSNSFLKSLAALQPHEVAMISGKDDQNLKILFACNDGTIQQWTPSLQQPSANPNAATPANVDFFQNIATLEPSPEDRVSTWYRWPDHSADEETQGITHIKINHRQDRILVGNWQLQQSRMLDLKSKEQIASATFAGDIAFDPADELLVEQHGMVYDAELILQLDFSKNKKTMEDTAPGLSKVFWINPDSFLFASKWGYVYENGKRGSVGNIAIGSLRGHLDWINRAFIAPAAVGRSAVSKMGNGMAWFQPRGSTSSYFEHGIRVDADYRCISNSSRLATAANQHLHIDPVNEHFARHPGDIRRSDGSLVSKMNPCAGVVAFQNGRLFTQDFDQKTITVDKTNGEQFKRVDVGYPVWENIAVDELGRYMITTQVGADQELRISLFDIDSEQSLKATIVVPEFKVCAQKHQVRKELHFNGDHFAYVHFYREWHFKESFVTIINLKTYESKTHRVDSGTVHIDGAPQLVTRDGIFEVGSDADISKVDSFASPKGGYGTPVAGFVDTAAEGSPTRVLFAYDRTDRVSYDRSTAWWSSTNGWSRKRNVKHSVFNWNMDVENKRAFSSEGRVIQFVPVDDRQPIRFVFSAEGPNTLVYDEFGNIDASAFQSPIDEVVVRTLHYPGGKVVPLTDQQWWNRVIASRTEKAKLWLTDIGCELDFDGEEKRHLRIGPTVRLSVLEMDKLQQLLPTHLVVEGYGLEESAASLGRSDWTENLVELQVGLNGEKPGTWFDKLIQGSPNLSVLRLQNIKLSTLQSKRIRSLKRLKTIQLDSKTMSSESLKLLSEALPACEIQTR